MVFPIDNPSQTSWPSLPRTMPFLSGSLPLLTGSGQESIMDLPISGGSTSNPKQGGELDGIQANLLTSFERASSQSSLVEYSVNGVVEDIEGSYASVILLYGGRENQFLFEVDDLQRAGAAYPGALIKISVGSDFGYKLVHSAEQEAVARNEAPPPDLSFLDE